MSRFRLLFWAIMSSIALGAAFAAVQLVHQAHSKVKTSRARCARLVERCQFVVDRLERIAAMKGGDAITGERIRELERAFAHTAQTIVHVGQQGIIASLLQLESNAQRIESCNEALTELISLFNLEEIVDVRRWQSDLEVARVRDHRELLSLGQRIESENAAINRELARQGATIAEVLTVIHNINASLQNAQSAWETLKIAMPLSVSDAAGPPAPTPTGVSFDDKAVALGRRLQLQPPTYTATTPRRPVRTAKKVTDTGTSDGESPALCAAPCCVSPGGTGSEGTMSKSATTLRRLSKSTFTKKCVKMVPLANVLSRLSSSLSPSTSSRSPSSRGAAATRSNVANSYSPRDGSLPCDSGDDDVRSSASSSSWCPLPAEPPPPYQLRVANPAPGRERECIESGNADVGHRPSPVAISSSRFTTASVEAIRAPDSPVPVFPSPKLSTDSVFGGSTQSISSMSSEDGISPRPRCTRRNSAAGVRPVLRRRDTIRFARRVTLSSGYPTVKPII